MPRIREYTSTESLKPDDKGYSAWETAGRRIGPLYNQAAEDMVKAARAKAADLEDTALLYYAPAAGGSSGSNGGSGSSGSRGSSGSGGSGGSGRGRSSSPSYRNRDNYVESDVVSGGTELANKVVGNKGGKEINVAAGETSLNSSGFWTNTDNNDGKYVIGKTSYDAYGNPYVPTGGDLSAVDGAGHPTEKPTPDYLKDPRTVSGNELVGPTTPYLLQPGDTAGPGPDGGYAPTTPAPAAPEKSTAGAIIDWIGGLFEAGTRTPSSPSDTTSSGL